MTARLSFHAAHAPGGMDAAGPRLRKIFLVHHGGTLFNLADRVNDQLEPGLTKRGRYHARRRARALCNEARTASYAIYVSTPRWSVDAASAPADKFGPVIRCCDGFREHHMDVLQGRLRGAANRKLGGCERLGSPIGSTIAFLAAKPRGTCRSAL